jgi:hypothetical protein
MVTEEELYAFIADNAEEVDGVLMCRASLWLYLQSRGVDERVRKKVRTTLVKELEARGRVRRENPRSRRLMILDD